MNRLAEDLRAAMVERQRRREYYHSLPLFARECLDWGGGGLTGEQLAALERINAGRRFSLRGPHGLGKSCLMSIVILWFALTRDAAGVDWKIPTTASVWRQLEKYLWPEIHKWAKRVRWDRVGRAPFRRDELLDLSMKLSHGEAFALASDKPESLEGAHASEILYVLDEAKAIPAGTWEAVEGAMSTGHSRMIACSTPGEPAGTFYDIHRRAPGYEDWDVMHVSLDQCIASGRITREWAEQRSRQWGETSAVYQNRVLGEFASGDEDGVIPLSWVEAANARWEELAGDFGPVVRLAQDVAWTGEDRSVMAVLCERGVKELRETSKEDTMQTAGRVAAMMDLHQVPALIDVIGLGAGVYSRLLEQGKRAVAFNAAAGSDRKDRSEEFGFVNLRAEAWWGLREQLDPAFGATLALPPDDLLTGDLTAPRWKIASSGKIQIEAKDDIKKRIGRSTDYGDAVVMACWTPQDARRDPQILKWED